MIDSAEIATVAPALLYLAEQYPLSITLRGTEQFGQRTAEVVKLLSGSRYSEPVFVLAVGDGDFFHSMRGANLANIAAATQENYAFKLGVRR